MIKKLAILLGFAFFYCSALSQSISLQRTGSNTLTLSNFTSNGAIGTAAATIDAYAEILIPQTTASISLTIPSPTNTTVNWKIRVYNTGSTTVTVNDIIIPVARYSDFSWAGSAWTTEAIANRRTARKYGITSTATLIPEYDTYDLFVITAQTADITIANKSTTVYNDGDQFRIRIKDNGTARAISFGTDYAASSDLPFPITTIVNKTIEMLMEYNEAMGKVVMVSYLTNI